MRKITHLILALTLIGWAALSARTNPPWTYSKLEDQCKAEGGKTSAIHARQTTAHRGPARESSEIRKQRSSEKIGMRQQCRDTRFSMEGLKQAVNDARQSDELPSIKADLKKASQEMDKMQQQLQNCYHLTKT